MDPSDVLLINLRSPVVLAFVLGAVATLVRSDLKFPEELYTALSIYLLLAIGLKGGAELSHTPLAAVWRPILATGLLGVVTPLFAYGVLRRLGRFDIANAAGIAAHYGSVSVVTFTAGISFLRALSVPFEGFLPTLVVLLEIPGIVVALAIARIGTGAAGSWREVAHEILAGRSIVLLLGGLVIGCVAGKPGLAPVAPLFVEGFQGAVMLFLLDMGMVAARRLRDVRQVGPFLVGFAVGVPILHGLLGVWLGKLAGLSTGGGFMLGVLAASASYIAAPAAVRIALPKANPSYYLTAVLGITFPFNLTLGIPLYYGFSRLLHGG